MDDPEVIEELRVIAIIIQPDGSFAIDGDTDEPETFWFLMQAAQFLLTGSGDEEEDED